MNKTKDLLMPLALIFAAIAIFKTGSQYGATKMRAYAIADEMKLPLSIYVNGQQSMDEQSAAQWASMIDNGILTGAIHRQIWYLNKESKAKLDQVLGYALKVRGDATIEQLKKVAHSDQANNISPVRLAEVTAAVTAAKRELVGETPIAAVTDDTTPIVTTEE